MESLFSVGITHNAVTIGFVIVDEQYRNQGIGTALVNEFEKRVKFLNYQAMVVGTAPEEEEFYLKMGFIPNLFIQAQGISIDDLRSLNPVYTEVRATEYNGWNQLMLQLTDLNHNYKISIILVFLVVQLNLFL